MYEANAAQRRARSLEVFTTDQEIDIGCVPDSLGINACHPGSDGVAADDGVGDRSLRERSGSPAGTFANGVHGGNHPVPGEVFQRDGHGVSVHDQRAMGNGKRGDGRPRANGQAA
jgi:hypothetical protein